MSAIAQTVEELRSPGRMIHVAARPRRHAGTVGALRKAAARWREFDVYCDRADFEDAVLAMRDAMGFEDEAGFVIRRHVRAAFDGIGGAR